MVAGRLANLDHGARADQSRQLATVTQQAAADMLNVGKRSVERAREVIDNGAPELVQAVERPCLNSRPFADSSLIGFGYRQSGNDAKRSFE